MLKAPIPRIKSERSDERSIRCGDRRAEPAAQNLRAEKQKTCAGESAYMLDPRSRRARPAAVVMRVEKEEGLAGPRLISLVLSEA